MNKIKTYLAAGGCLLAMALTTACEDRLSALPSQSKVDDNLIVDQKSAEYALNGIYYMYAQCGTDNYDVLSTGCTLSQEIYPATSLVQSLTIRVHICWRIMIGPLIIIRF